MLEKPIFILLAIVIISTAIYFYYSRIKLSHLIDKLVNVYSQISHSPCIFVVVNNRFEVMRTPKSCDNKYIITDAGTFLDNSFSGHNYNTFLYQIGQASVESEVVTADYLFEDEDGEHRFTGYFTRVSRNRILCMFQCEDEQLERMKKIVNLERIKQINDAAVKISNIGIAYITPDYVVQWKNSVIDTYFTKVGRYTTNSKCFETLKNLSKPCHSCIMHKVMGSREIELKEICISPDLIVEAKAIPLFSENDKFQGVVMAYNDVTIDRMREAELIEAKDKAEQSDRLKSTFLANMSHEIRTPLNSILGFSELLINSEVYNAEERESYYQVIKTNSELLLQLINDILDLSKIEANTLEFEYTNVDVNAIMLDLERSFSFKYSNSDFVIVFEKPYPNGAIYTDGHRIQQVLSNFITNATKFTDTGKIAFGCELRDAVIYFYVTDTGRGIPEDMVERIFQRFVKLNNLKTGIGLGLSICHTIVKMLHGDIGVWSKEGVGSTFWFTIPVGSTITKE